MAQCRLARAALGLQLGLELLRAHAPPQLEQRRLPRRRIRGLDGRELRGVERAAGVEERIALDLALGFRLAAERSAPFGLEHEQVHANEALEDLPAHDR